MQNTKCKIQNAKYKTKIYVLSSSIAAAVAHSQPYFNLLLIIERKSLLDTKCKIQNAKY